MLFTITAAKITKICKNLSLFSTVLPLITATLSPVPIMAAAPPFRGENGRGVVAHFPRAARNGNGPTRFYRASAPVGAWKSHANPRALGPKTGAWRRKTEDQRPKTGDQRTKTKSLKSKVYNSQLYFTVLPSFTAFCGCIRLRVPSACSAINTIPCDSTPLMFFGARLMSISTCLPTRSCGS